MHSQVTSGYGGVRSGDVSVRSSEVRFWYSIVELSNVL